MTSSQYYLKQLRTKQSDIKTDYDLNLYDLDGNNKNKAFENKHKENIRKLENNYALNNLKLDNKYEESLEKIELDKAKEKFNLIKKEGEIKKSLESQIHENNKEKLKTENEHLENLKKK